MAKTIVFTADNVDNFVNWLKKFSAINSSVLLEINNTKKAFVAKSYNDEKSVVKFSEISFENAGFILKKAFSEDLIKIGIFNIPQLIKSFDQFKNGEFEFQIKYDKVDEDWAGLNLLLKNSSLKIKVNGASLNIFKYISDELFENITSTNEVVSFNLPINTIEEILSLTVLDKEYKFLEFIIKDKKISVQGKTFELSIEAANGTDSMLSIYKKQFDKIDKENYNIQFGDDKLVFKSLDTNTVTVLSMVVKDSNYDEEVTKFD